MPSACTRFDPGRGMHRDRHEPVFPIAVRALELKLWSDRVACHSGTTPNGYNSGAATIAHLAETPFGFLASTFLPITTQTPKHLGFGVFMPFGVRRDTPFGLKMLASWRNGISDYRTFVPLIFGLTDFLFFGGHMFRQFKSILMPPELPG